jgi:hypothetical protein
MYTRRLQNYNKMSINNCPMLYYIEENARETIGKRQLFKKEFKLPFVASVAENSASCRH